MLILHGNVLIGRKKSYSVERDADDVADEHADAKESADGIEQNELPDVCDVIDVSDAGRVPNSLLLKNHKHHPHKCEFIASCFACLMH